MMPDIKLRQLRYFVLVAELEGYHAAAQRAARSQPAISLAIKELEQRLALAPNDPELCFVALSEPRVERDIGLLSRQRQTLSPAAKALRETILEQTALIEGGNGQ